MQRPRGGAAQQCRPAQRDPRDLSHGNGPVDAARASVAHGRPRLALQAADAAEPLIAATLVSAAASQKDQNHKAKASGQRIHFSVPPRPKFGSAVSWPASMMPRRISRVRVK